MNHQELNFDSHVNMPGIGKNAYILSQIGETILQPYQGGVGGCSNSNMTAPTVPSPRF